MSDFRFLMCPPDYFEVDYVINPWMEGNITKVDKSKARAEWNKLYETISKYAKVAILEPAKGWPDMVFTANAAIVKGGKVVLANFRYPERSGEEPYNKSWFEKDYSQVFELPKGLYQEGAGDALFQRGDYEFLWGGGDHRSNPEAYPLISKWLDREIVVLKQDYPEFYHLDIAMCPLENGYLMYFPEAFDQESVAKIEARVPKNKRIILTREDALNFSGNCVNIGDVAIMNKASDDLQKKLNDSGFQVIQVPVPEFLKAGGATKCLTLRLE